MVAKGFLKLPTLDILIKKKRDLALETFDVLVIVFPTKVNLLYLLYALI